MRESLTCAEFDATCRYGQVSPALVRRFHQLLSELSAASPLLSYTGSQSDLRRLMRCSDRQLRRARAVLERLGVLETSRDYAYTGGHLNYHLLGPLPEIAGGNEQELELAVIRGVGVPNTSGHDARKSTQTSGHAPDMASGRSGHAPDMASAQTAEIEPETTSGRSGHGPDDRFEDSATGSPVSRSSSSTRPDVPDVPEPRKGSSGRTGHEISAQLAGSLQELGINPAEVTPRLWDLEPRWQQWVVEHSAFFGASSPRYVLRVVEDAERAAALGLAPPPVGISQQDFDDLLKQARQAAPPSPAAARFDADGGMATPRNSVSKHGWLERIKATVRPRVAAAYIAVDAILSDGSNR